MYKESPADILIVDDIPENLRLLGDVLSEAGYRVRQAPSGKLALRAAEHQPPDLIMLDIGMPEMDGFEVCRRLKQMPALKAVPVIYISAFTGAESKIEAFDAGGVDYLTKPFEAKEVLARVKVHCGLKMTQEALQEQNVELANTLELLKETQMQLVQNEKMASLGVLTAGLAHEINNPINFISSCSVGMEKVIVKLRSVVHKCALSHRDSVCEELNSQCMTLVDDMNELLSSVRTGSNRAAEIVRGLRTFSRLDEASKKPCDINENLDSALLLLSHRLSKDISVEKEYGEIPQFFCFPGKLNQVFMNCFSNALDAMEDNSPDQPRRLRVGSGIEMLNGKRYLAVDIEDTGSGLKGDEGEHLFEPFFTTKEVGKGVGLGLSISHGIIQDHDGTIILKNLPERGVRAEIRLPFVEA
ncbi:MAG TPA: response regulator [Pontiella sp.]